MPPRLRPTRLEYVVDGVRLRAQLSAAALDAAGDEPEQRIGPGRLTGLFAGAYVTGAVIPVDGGIATTA